MALNTDWKEFLSLLVLCDVEFLIVGAWARAAHGEPRMTGDIDFWVRPAPANASRVLDVVQRFGFGSLGLSEGDLTEPDQVIQLGFPPRRIDILTGLTALNFESAWSRRVNGVLDGIAVQYLSREDFVRNKLALGRPKDLADIEALIAEDFTSEP